MWLLQRPTHRDHGPTEHGRNASALQVHLKDPQTLHPYLTPCLEDLQTNPTISGVSSISKVFVVVGFCVWHPTMLTTNPTRRVGLLVG
jgi:hypothetical protein